MKTYQVTGMSCAACSARVEKAVSQVPGVTVCAVNLLTNSMGVEGTASPEAIVRAVEAAGYGASLQGGGNAPAKDPKDPLEDRQSPVLLRRLLWSLGFLLVLMYVSMGHMMADFPMPAFFEHNPVAMGLLQMALSALILVINQKFFISGFKGLIHGAPNMDTLVALGSGVSFLYSTCVLFLMTGDQVAGNGAMAMERLHGLYFESAAMILTLITVGKLLEARSKGKTTNALRSLMNLAPKTATVEREGQEQQIPVEQVRVGDIFLVRPGESVPVDGEVLEGESAVNESALTGESIPVDKGPGSAVSAATINQSGFLRCRASRVGEDTALSQIIRLVSDTAATKAPIAKVADKVSGIFVPVVIGIALVTMAVWLILGESFGFALARSISVLVISCPCALGLATPVAIMVGSGVGAKNGILFKTAESLEETGKVQIVVLDKTGTITAGTPEVTDLCPAPGISETELLTFAAGLERRSEHPLAKAVLALANERNLPLTDAEDFRALPGNGLEGKVQGRTMQGGSVKFMDDCLGKAPELKTKAHSLAACGKTPLVFSREGKLLGIIAVADTVKADSPQAIRELRNMGIRVVMLTGDNQATAEAVGREAGVDEVIAGVLPDGKENVIRRLRTKGKVAMVGDGINDAPALTRADVGIAIGAGTDVAMDAADLVLMSSRLSDVPAAIRLSRATLRNIHENLFWAFFYNSVGIPLAAGVFISLFGWELNPMFGAAAMSLSSFCVVTNALRLNWTKLRSTRHDHKIKQQKERKTMTKTMKIQGMMCPHCEARVKKTLEAMEQVAEAQVSHTEGTAIVTLIAPVANEVLKKTIEDQGYPVLDIQ